jgi:hypothetical protein
MLNDEPVWVEAQQRQSDEILRAAVNELGPRGRRLGRGLGAHSAAHVPRIRNETEGSFRVAEVVPNLGLHPCSRITIEGLNEASYSADACSEREPEIVQIHVVRAGGDLADFHLLEVG